MQKNKPVIIEVALNGSTKKRENRYVPISQTEIVKDALDCLELGAQIVHQHDRLESDSEAERAPEIMAQKSRGIYEKILAVYPDALLYPTANWGGSTEDRWKHQEILADAGYLQMAYLDPGSTNIGIINSKGIPKGITYDHSYEEIERLFSLAKIKNLAPSISIFEPGFLRTVLAYWENGSLPRGAFIKLYFGERLIFGLPPTQTALEAYLELLDGITLPWGIAVLGGDVIASDIAETALRCGGHLRVGLEDYSGQKTPRNKELVQEAISLCADVGRPLADRGNVKRILDFP